MSYGRLAPVRPPGGGYGGARPSEGRGPLARALAKDSVLRHMDWVLIAAVLALALIGTLLVWSATRAGLEQAGGNPNTYLEKQLLNVAIGLALLIAVSLINYRILRTYTPLVYAAACLGLLVVLSPLGATVNGAHSWIALPGGFQIEPSEFAKIGMILMLAVILGDLHERAYRPGALEIALALACGGLPLLLVILQPDLGVTILLLVLLVGMIAVSGVRLRWLAGLGAAGALAVLAIWSLHLLKPYQVQRLTAFLHPNGCNQSTPGVPDPCYQLQQAEIAIGSGQKTGRGNNATQTKLNFLPANDTDFVFAAVGETYGFVGAAVVLSLYALLIWRALRILTMSKNLFGTLIAAGILAMLMFQIFVNVGMTIGIMPITGVPLPLLSYGGSSVIVTFIAIGLLESIYVQARMAASGKPRTLIS